MLISVPCICLLATCLMVILALWGEKHSSFPLTYEMKQYREVEQSVQSHSREMLDVPGLSDTAVSPLKQQCWMPQFQKYIHSQWQLIFSLTMEKHDLCNSFLKSKLKGEESRPCLVIYMSYRIPMKYWNGGCFLDKNSTSQTNSLPMYI